MTERELEILGFEKESEYGSDNKDWYYYSYNIVDGLSFISCDMLMCLIQNQQYGLPKWNKCNHL